jgi:ABC-type multidrug transport system fused ATPase/permease subunit
VDKATLVRAIASYDKWRLTFGVVAAMSAVFVIAIQIRLLKLNADLSAIKDTEGEENTRKLASVNARAEEAVASAANAVRDTEVARREAAEANERAAKANEVAEGERLARVKIEERIAPRVLSPAQLADIKTRVQPFASGATKVAFLAPADSEPAHLGKPLLDMLRSAGWMVSNLWGHNIARAVGGILVEVSADASDETKKAAFAFVSAIRAVSSFIVLGPAPWETIKLVGQFGGEGMPPVKNMQELEAQLHTATIRITIGEK